MGSDSGVLRFTTALVTGLLIATATAAAAADHPTLVSVKDTDCTMCHEDLVDGKITVHAPVADDCTTCHEFTIDGGTRVALVDDEPALCVMCHDGMSSAVDATLSTPHAPVTDSCLTCHDPHASGEPHLLLAPLTTTCTTCHDAAELGTLHGDQITEATNCAACHRPHGSDSPRMLSGKHQHRPFADGSCKGCHRQPFGDRIRLRARGERLCEACHGDMSRDAGEHGTVHAALRGEKGRAGCLACHDAHMSDQPKLLLAAGPDVCATCHEPLVHAANSDTGHAPAADDCLNCHRPHASEQARLLEAAPGELCRTCHDVEDEALAGVHLGADLAGLECLSCHDAHGSGHPKLLARNLHAPLEGGCDTCHEGSADRLAEDGDSPLCLMCHDDIGEAAKTAAAPHAALELARCADCHNPHASAQRSLVKDPNGAVCTACHEEQAAGEGEVAHGVITAIGCEACHEPHGGSREKLLRADAEALCLACHDSARLPDQQADSVRWLDHFDVPVELARAAATLRLTPDGERGHPVLEHRVLGEPTKVEMKNTVSTFQGQLTCLTCHDPHKGRTRTILNWDAASTTEACNHCHEK